MRPTIVFRGILTLGLAVVLLAATASAASAFRTFTPTSADFGDRQVGTTSPPQAFTLTVFRLCFPSPIGCIYDSLNVAPDVSGDFALTHNCPPTLAVTPASPTAKSCTINVTFTPLSTGPKQSALCTNSQAGATGCRVVPDQGPSATLAGNGVTVETPPTPPTPGPLPPGQPGEPGAPGAQPLTLDLDAKKQELKKKLTFFATANLDSTLVAEGSVKETTKQLVGGEKTKVKAKLKSKKRKKLAQQLDRKGKAKTKVEAGAVTAAGSSDIDEIKVKLKD